MISRLFSPTRIPSTPRSHPLITYGRDVHSNEHLLAAHFMQHISVSLVGSESHIAYAQTEVEGLVSFCGVKDLPIGLQATHILDHHCLPCLCKLGIGKALRGSYEANCVSHDAQQSQEFGERITIRMLLAGSVPTGNCTDGAKPSRNWNQLSWAPRRQECLLLSPIHFRRSQRAMCREYRAPLVSL